jgi:tetratricopeptide (TPR) repeat protein
MIVIRPGLIRPGRAAATVLLLAGLLPAAAAGSTADQYVEQAAAFMKKNRESGDPSWYARASAALEQALAADPAHYAALRARAWVLLGQHDFAAARTAAEAARAREPGDWWNHATLTDACVELGDYACAAEAADTTVALRPGLASYARVAFLRALLGDRAGAREAMQLAVAAANPADHEARAWALVHLGHEHFASGDLGGARAAYESALAAVPDYHLALGPLARVRAAQGDLRAAAGLYRRAVARVPSVDLYAELGDLHLALGDRRGAEEAYAAIDDVARVAAATGISAGRELARFYADHERDLAQALALARAEAAARRDIYTDDLLAWALHRNGDHRRAMRAAHRALRLGTEDARLHYHAGMIAAACGRPRQAARHLGRALATNPYFDLLEAPVARARLAALGDVRAVREGTR